MEASTRYTRGDIPRPRATRRQLHRASSGMVEEWLAARLAWHHEAPCAAGLPSSTSSPSAARTRPTRSAVRGCLVSNSVTLILWCKQSSSPPRQRVNKMLDERLHLLGGIPDRRRRPIRRLVMRLRAAWARRSVRDRLPGLSPGSLGGSLGPALDGTTSPAEGRWIAATRAWIWTPTGESNPPPP